MEYGRRQWQVFSPMGKFGKSLTGENELHNNTCMKVETKGGEGSEFIIVLSLV